MSLSVLSLPTFARHLTTRGAQIELPFEIRVLLDERKPGTSFSLEGLNLRDERNRTLGDASLKCRFEKDPRFLMQIISPLTKAFTKSWVCRAGDYERHILGAARFEVNAGFIAYDNETFRDAIELVPRGENLLIINDLGIEHYVAGLINREIRSDWPEEAVKAQAIAARSYALAQAADRRARGDIFDLHSTIKDQVYRGTSREDGRSHRLVRETAGKVLIHREEVLKAYYHASSGGHSELPQSVWGDEGSNRDAYAFLARRSEYDEDLMSSSWQIQLSPKLGLQWSGVGLLREIRILERTTGQRVKKMLLLGSDGEEIISGPELRRRLGVNWVRSTYFHIVPEKKGWILEGRGHGHGVGLSQLGARAMGKLGKSAEEILNHYYPYANIRKLPLDVSAPQIQTAVR